ncbi:hypothetical protein AAMO2058_000265800 [Amorphochlora amoebiformis]
MTITLLEEFGVHVTTEQWAQHHVFTVHQQAYTSPLTFTVEPDASSASYFLAAGTIRGCGPISIDGLSKGSPRHPPLQGDIDFIRILDLMGGNVRWNEGRVTVFPCEGKLKGIHANLNHIPDAAMTVAALATRANSPTTIEGIGSWRVKECDRIEAMASELSKIGARVEVGSDWIRIHPVNAEVRKSIQSSSKTSNSVRISTYKDHRIAMSLAILSLGEEGIEMEIEDPGCVAKTFPEFFRELDRLTIRDAR